MKTRERLARIKKSKSWVERMALAADRLPGTRFDFDLPHLLGALRTYQNYPPAKRVSYMLPGGQIDLGGLAEHTLAGYGVDMATAIANKDADWFRDWAAAIDAWGAHKPFADRLRAAIIRFCVPPKGVFSVRKIEDHLVKLKLAPPALRYDEHDDLRRTIRRICAESNIRTDHKPGRTRKADTKPKKADR